MDSPPSADAHPAAMLVELVNELEASVAHSEAQLVSREWPQLSAALAEQRRLTHAIANEVARTEGIRPPGFTDGLYRRLRAVECRRTDQLRRLQAFHDAVGARLTVMARAKAMRRAQTPDVRPALLDSLR